MQREIPSWPEAKSEFLELGWVGSNGACGMAPLLRTKSKGIVPTLISTRERAIAKATQRPPDVVPVVLAYYQHFAGFFLFENIVCFARFWNSA